MCACGGQKQASQHDDALADTTVVADTVKTDDEDEDFANTPMPKAADELFDDFIFNFCANRKLQMERVAFPLPSVKGDHQTTISKGQWKMEHFFMEQGYYTLLFDNERHMEVVKDTSVRHAIVEKIFFDTGNIQQLPCRVHLLRIAVQRIDEPVPERSAQYGKGSRGHRASPVLSLRLFLRRADHADRKRQDKDRSQYDQFLPACAHGSSEIS